jgi:hypothetical protein
MNACVACEFWMEGSNHHRTLSSKDNVFIVARQNRYILRRIRAICGARINTAWKSSTNPSRAISVSNCQFDDRRHCASHRCQSAPKLLWSGRPSSTPLANRIIPAQVPNTGIPCFNRASIASNNPEVKSKCDIVVDSPPGITNASTASKSEGVRT